MSNSKADKIAKVEQKCKVREIGDLTEKKESDGDLASDLATLSITPSSADDVIEVKCSDEKLPRNNSYREIETYESESSSEDDKNQQSSSKSPPTNNSNRCPVCKHNFSTKGNLTQHQRKGQCGVGVSCVCREIFKNQQFLNRHLNTCPEGEAEKLKRIADMKEALIEKWKESAVILKLDPESVKLAPWEDEVIDGTHRIERITEIECLSMLNEALKHSEFKGGHLLATTGAKLSNGGYRGYNGLGFHQAVAILKFGRARAFTVTGDTKHDTSHLCSKRNCFNYLCIVVETKTINGSRKSCAREESCIYLHDGTRCILPTVVPEHELQQRSVSESQTANQELVGGQEEANRQQQLTANELNSTIDLLNSLSITKTTEAPK